MQLSPLSGDRTGCWVDDEDVGAAMLCGRSDSLRSLSSIWHDESMSSFNIGGRLDVEAEDDDDVVDAAANVGDSKDRDDEDAADATTDDVEVITDDVGECERFALFAARSSDVGECSSSRRSCFNDLAPIAISRMISSSSLLSWAVSMGESHELMRRMSPERECRSRRSTKGSTWRPMRSFARTRHSTWRQKRIMLLRITPLSISSLAMTSVTMSVMVEVHCYTTPNESMTLHESS